MYLKSSLFFKYVHAYEEIIYELNSLEHLTIHVYGLHTRGEVWLSMRTALDT